MYRIASPRPCPARGPGVESPYFTLPYHIELIGGANLEPLNLQVEFDVAILLLDRMACAEYHTAICPGRKPILLDHRWLIGLSSTGLSDFWGCGHYRAVDARECLLVGWLRIDIAFAG